MDMTVIILQKEMVEMPMADLRYGPFMLSSSFWILMRCSHKQSRHTSCNQWNQLCLLLKLVRDLYVMLDEIHYEEAPVGLKMPESFYELSGDMKNTGYNSRLFAFKPNAMMESMDKELRPSRLILLKSPCKGTTTTP